MTPRPKQWVVRESAPPEFLAANLDLPPIAIQLLWNRGITERADVERFLNPDYQTDLHDPFTFRHMARAVARTRLAIANHELIVVHGDYDADGVCGAAVIWTTLKALGANVDVFLPHREHDGYGMHERTVHELKGKGASVIITCDCGISNVKEIAVAQSLGIDVIITDHHTLPPELPQAFAILHPGAPGETYPWKGLSGGGVAFKFAQALLRECGSPEPGFEKWLLDLVAISSVADLVPLRSETRTLVHFGLKVLERTRRLGLRRLMQSAGVLDDVGRPRRTITTTTIGFMVAPRINAAGRMDHASLAFQALTTSDVHDADVLAAKLASCNTARQQAVEILMSEARALSSRDTLGPVVVVGTGWPLGLLGLIASKLAEERYRPAFAFSDRSGVLTGSGRSIPHVDLMHMLRARPELMTKFGGHAQACGITLTREQLPPLTEHLNAMFVQAMRGQQPAPTISIDAELAPNDVTAATVEAVSRFAPFGMENPEPIFLLKNVRVASAETIGADGKHLRMLGMVEGRPHKFIAFKMGNRSAELASGRSVDVLLNLRTNEWNGRTSLELSVVDFVVR